MVHVLPGLYMATDEMRTEEIFTMQATLDHQTKTKRIPVSPWQKWHNRTSQSQCHELEQLENRLAIAVV